MVSGEAGYTVFFGSVAASFCFSLAATPTSCLSDELQKALAWPRSGDGSSVSPPGPDAGPAASGVGPGLLARVPGFCHTPVCTMFPCSSILMAPTEPPVAPAPACGVAAAAAATECFGGTTVKVFSPKREVELWVILLCDTEAE